MNRMFGVGSLLVLAVMAPVLMSAQEAEKLAVQLHGLLPRVAAVEVREQFSMMLEPLGYAPVTRALRSSDFTANALRDIS